MTTRHTPTPERRRRKRRYLWIKQDRLCVGCGEPTTWFDAPNGTIPPDAAMLTKRTGVSVVACYGCAQFGKLARMPAAIPAAKPKLCSNGCNASSGGGLCKSSPHLTEDNLAAAQRVREMAARE